ncbi:DUF6212 domain-containing protein [Roseomonas sp. WA12]
MTPRTDPTLLPRLASGLPIVLVAEGVMDPSPLSVPGLEAWVVSTRGGATLIHPFGTRAPEPEAAVALETPPMGAVALVASERLRVAPLSRWWAEASGLPAPPFLLAATGHAALPGLLALLAEALAEARTREAVPAGALTAAREEMEETRESMADTARFLAHRPPAAPRLVLSGEAGEAAPISGAWRHQLGTGLAGLAAIAIHLVGPASGTGLLRIRLIGAESDRVVGSWAIPATELAPGWLTLDLPTPLGPVRETAMLEVIPEGESLPALSRDARWAGPEGEHPVALRAWAGAPGSRYLVPAHWLPEEVGLTLPAPEIPLALPAESWEAARSLEGGVDPVALGDEAQRPLLRAAAGGRALVLLPHLHAPGLDRLRITFAAGTGRGASVGAWVHPVDAELTDADALDRPAPGFARTGWRDLPEEGIELTLPLSARLSGRASLVIGLRAGDKDAVVEVAGVTLSAVGPGQALPAPAVPEAAVGNPAPAQSKRGAPSGSPASSAPPSPAAPSAAPAVLRQTSEGTAPSAEPVGGAPAPVKNPGEGQSAMPAVPDLSPAAPDMPAASEPAREPNPPAGAAPAAPVQSLPTAPIRMAVPIPPIRPAPPRATPVPPAQTPASPVDAPTVSAPPRTPAAAIPPTMPRVPVAPSLPLPPMPRPLGSPVPATPAGPAASAVAPASSPAMSPAAAQRPAAPPPRAAPSNAAPGRAPARYETVRLHQHLPGESYRHIDMTVASLAQGPTRWASVRVKLASKDGEPRLEFRQAAGWPHMFRDWLGRGSDKFGPFLRITLPELRDFLDSITDERDAAMMQALLAVLPQAAEEASRQAGLSVTDTGEWAEGARMLQEKGTPAA